MKPLPKSEHALLLRTDFSSLAAWESIVAAACAPSAELRAYTGYELRADVELISDREYEGVTPEQLVSLNPEGQHTFVFVVDRIALTHPEHPILVVDLYTEPGRTFRVIPSEMAGVENNLSLANMDYAEFADHVDPDGIFRGFEG